MDYYEILGLPKTAAKDDVKKAYRHLALIHHPDRGGDAEKFKQISQAYDVLVDDHKRNMYDTTSFRGHGSADPFRMFQQMFNPAEIFNTFANQFKSQQKLPDNLYTVTIKLRDSLNGLSKVIPISYMKTCSCLIDCISCGGEGYYNSIHRTGPFVTTSRTKCKVCDSKGVAPQQSHYCMVCDNSYKQEYIENVEITVPKGVPDNWTVRLPNKGSFPTNKTQLRGDLVVCIKILEGEDSGRIKRVNNDIVYSETVDLADILIGKQLRLDVFGDSMIVNVNATSLENKKIIIKHKGISWQNATGDLIVDLRVIYPSKIELSDEERSVLDSAFKTVGWK